MGYIRLSGIVLWTGLFLSAVQVSIAGKALSEASNVACAGSLCDTETVKRRSSRNGAMFTSRKLMLASELPTSHNDDLFLDRVKREDMVFGEDYEKPPPPPHVAPVGQSPNRRASSPPVASEPAFVPPPPTMNFPESSWLERSLTPAPQSVRQRSFRNRAIFIGRKLVVASELSTSRINDLDRDDRWDMLFNEDYAGNPPPPPRQGVPGSSPHNDLRPPPPKGHRVPPAHG